VIVATQRACDEINEAGMKQMPYNDNEQQKSGPDVGGYMPC